MAGQGGNASLIPVLGRQKQVDLCESEDGLVYIESSRTVIATCDSVSINELSPLCTPAPHLPCTQSLGSIMTAILTLKTLHPSSSQQPIGWETNTLKLNDLLF